MTATDINGDTYSFDVCSNCKSTCCQGANPPLTPKRKKIIAEFVRKRGAHVANLFVDKAYAHIASDSEEYCTFYSQKTGKCIIHEVKPETCVAGPITFDINLKNHKIEWFLKQSSICTFAQKLYEHKEKFNAHLKAAQPQILHLICELDAKSLSAILKIPEPETFKIGENELPRQVLKKLGIA